MALREAIAVFGLCVFACGPKAEPETASDAADETSEGSAPSADTDTGADGEKC